MIKREGMNRKEYGDVSGFPFVKTKKTLDISPSCRLYADFCVAFCCSYSGGQHDGTRVNPGDGNDH